MQRLNIQLFKTGILEIKKVKVEFIILLPKEEFVLVNKSKISWTQVETGSAITWKYPSVILKGDNSIGEFYSVAVTNNISRLIQEPK